MTEQQRKLYQDGRELHRKKSTRDSKGKSKTSKKKKQYSRANNLTTERDDEEESQASSESERESNEESDGNESDPDNIWDNTPPRRGNMMRRPRIPRVPCSGDSFLRAPGSGPKD